MANNPNSGLKETCDFIPCLTGTVRAIAVKKLLRLWANLLQDTNSFSAHYMLLPIAKYIININININNTSVPMLYSCYLGPLTSSIVQIAVLS
jgi:hypothetical protein